jgi:hypothetical protein
MARWHAELQDYHFKIEHVPGRLHTAADALSRPPGSDQGKEDNQDISLLPEETFIRVLNEDSDDSLEQRIIQAQNDHAAELDNKTLYPLAT